MYIFIGCSPSTGSSLLCRILNRHPALYCGPETNLFIHPDLYTDWENSKKFILSNMPNILYGFKDMEFSLQPNIFLSNELGNSEINRMISTAPNLMEFSDIYFSQLLVNHDKSIWIEKTPANVTCFRYLKDCFTDPTLIMIVRNPLDAIYSLIRRGMNLYRAISIYLLYTSYGLSIDETVIIRYEDLVRQPEDTLKVLFNNFPVDFKADLTNVKNEDSDKIKMEGWTYAENDEIKSGAINNFKSAPMKVKNKILSGIKLLSIHPDYQDKHGLKFNNVPALAAEIGYSQEVELPSNATSVKWELRKGQLQFLWQRSKMGILKFKYNMPVSIESST